MDLIFVKITEIQYYKYHNNINKKIKKITYNMKTKMDLSNKIIKKINNKINQN
jgi:hypothetical protein